MNNNNFLIPLVIVSVLLVGMAGFGVWSFMGMQDYKNNVDEKISEAVVVAEENLSLKKDAEFAEEYKKPNMIFKGPAAYGTLTFSYPKTWSNYFNQDAGSYLVDGFMHKDFVSGNTRETKYAFRYQVTSVPYDQELTRFSSLVEGGRAKASAYVSPKQPTARAIRIEGEVEPEKQGTLVMIELRDRTIKVWTEGDQYKADFEKILQDFSFIQ